ncbi:MAG: MFS transporter, partial [Chlamydiota bacterium]
AFGAGLSPTVEMLIVFRGLQALGASTIFVASAALLSDVFPENERVRAISIYGGITGFGLMIGPFLGGILIAILDWRWVFWINLPLIAIGLAACSFSLKKHYHKKSNVRVDWQGLVLLIFGLGALMYGIVEGAQANWSSLFAWILLGSGTFALILMVIFDKKRKNPLLDFPIFKQRLIELAALSCALAGVASTVFMFFDPLYLRILRKLNPFWIGLLIATIPAAQALISFVFSRIVKRFGVANLLFFSVVAAFSAICLHRWIGLDTPLGFLVIPFFLLGINWGLSNSAMITAVNQVISSQKIGEALGTIATIWNIVGSLLLASSTAIFHAFQTDNSFLLPYHRVIDFNILFAAIILFTSIWIRIRIHKEAG